MLRCTTVDYFTTIKSTNVFKTFTFFIYLLRCKFISKSCCENYYLFVRVVDGDILFALMVRIKRTGGLRLNGAKDVLRESG